MTLEPPTIDDTRPWRGCPGASEIVCIVSGGNLDAAKLSAILEGRVP